MLEEIQDMQGEIFDQDAHDAFMAECWHDMEWNAPENWPFDDDADLERFSLECAFGPEE